MKKFFIPILFILFQFIVHSQNDSVIFVNANWTTNEIGNGLIHKEYQFKKNLFHSFQNINIIEVKNINEYFFEIGYETKMLIPTSEFGKRVNAIAAINGTFFDMKNGGSVCFLKAKDSIINDNQIKNDKRGIHQQGAVIIKNGFISIENNDENLEWENKIDANEIMTSGPMLIINNLILELDSVSFNITRHPRTAVGINDSNHVYLITVDGRNENAEGMSLFELQKIIYWLGCKDGINLDGGGSTTLWINGCSFNGVVNYPTDNKQWDHFGERPVANVILLMKRN